MSVRELGELIQEFVRLMELHKERHLQTGHAPFLFSRYRLLEPLARTYYFDTPSGMTFPDREPYVLRLRWRNFADLSLLMLGTAPIDYEWPGSAALYPGPLLAGSPWGKVAPAELGNLRGKVVDLKIKVLRDLAGRLLEPASDSVAPCLAPLLQDLSDDEFALLLQADRGYAKKTIEFRGQRLRPYVAGGVSDLIRFVIWCEMEVRLGAFARVREMLGELVVDDGLPCLSAAILEPGSPAARHMEEALELFCTLSESQDRCAVLGLFTNLFPGQRLKTVKLEFGVPEGHTEEVQRKIEVMADYVLLELRYGGRVPWMLEPSAGLSAEAVRNLSRDHVLVVDSWRKQVWCLGQPVNCNDAEFTWVKALAKSPQQWVSHTSVARAWGGKDAGPEPSKVIFTLKGEFKKAHFAYKRALAVDPTAFRFTNQWQNQKDFASKALPKGRKGGYLLNLDPSQVMVI